MKNKHPFLLSVLLLFVFACSSNDDTIMEVTPLAQAEIVATRVVAPTPVPLEEAAVAPTHVAPVELGVPLMASIPRGQSRNNAYKQDLEITPEPDVLMEILNEEPIELAFNQFYNTILPEGSTTLEMSDFLQSLDGKQVVLEGYMAPPLKLGLDWFMLSRRPQASCAFCSGEADWVEDTILVYYYGEEFAYTPLPMRITGELHVGEVVDTQTGMVSYIRIYPEFSDMVKLSYE